MRRLPLDSEPIWVALVGVTVLGQALSGGLSAYVTYVLVPAARTSLRWGPAALGFAVDPVVVPLALAVGSFGFVRSGEAPTLGNRSLAALFLASLTGFYVGFWAVGVPAPTPGGAVPLENDLVAWQLFEVSPYLLWAWSAFLTPGLEGAVATLAGLGAASRYATR